MKRPQTQAQHKTPLVNLPDPLPHPTESQTTASYKGSRIGSVVKRENTRALTMCQSPNNVPEPIEGLWAQPRPPRAAARSPGWNRLSRPPHSHPLPSHPYPNPTCPLPLSRHSPCLHIPTPSALCSLAAQRAPLPPLLLPGPVSLRSTEDLRESGRCR